MVRTVVPNINSNSMLNYGDTTINMIEMEDELHMVKTIVPTGPDNFEKIICSPSKNEKLDFTSMTLRQTVASVSREG